MPGRAHDVIAVDIDGDGIEDIVQMSDHPDHPVLAWYRIPEDYNANWDYTKIGPGIHGGIDPKGSGDLNGNGLMDIMSGGGPLTQGTHKLFIWEMIPGMVQYGKNI